MCYCFFLILPLLSFNLELSLGCLTLLVGTISPDKLLADRSSSLQLSSLWFAGGHVKGFQVGICSTFNGEYPPENERPVYLKIHPAGKGETSTQTMLVFGGIIIGSISTQPTSTVTNPGVEFLDASKPPRKKSGKAKAMEQVWKLRDQDFVTKRCALMIFGFWEPPPKIFNIILDRIFKYMYRGC